MARFLLLAVGLLAMSMPAAGQSGKRVPQVGIVTFAFVSDSGPVRGFHQALRELGYSEGTTVHIEFRSAEGQAAKLPGLFAELLRRKVDVLVTEGTPAAIAAKKATETVPIVSAVMNDPVKLGLVKSLNRPAGNFTGLTFAAGDRTAKQLELIREAAPQARKVAVIYNDAVATNAERVAEVKRNVPSLALQLQFIPVHGAAGLDAALDAVAKSGCAAMVTMGDGMLWVNRRRIVEFAAKNRLPAAYPERDFADEGGLIAYGPNLESNFRRAAVYVDKILKGAKPGDLPIEQPTKLELVVNLRTAKALGLRIPQPVLVRADEVIQ